MPGLQCSFESYPVWLYDMSIENVEERRKQRQYFRTATAAANFLGIVPRRLFTKVATKEYAYHKETGKKYAVRKAIGEGVTI